MGNITNKYTNGANNNMSTIVSKTKDGAYKIAELQRTINASPLIVPSCISITASDTDLDLEFAIALDGAEDTALDTIILDHVPSVESWVGNDLVEVHVTQQSDSQGDKVATYVSSKPLVAGKTFYATWTGAGDNPTTGEIAGGDLLTFVFGTEDTELNKSARFHPDNGEVYLHDGYIKWEGAHIGDYITVRICSDATLLQQAANLDLILDGEWIQYSPSGPGTGTHGFAATPTLVPRSYSLDGDWDYTTAGGLVPNFDGTGSFKMANIKKAVHTFVNKMPLIGASESYMKLFSEESTLLPAGFSMDITVYCSDGSGTLQASTIIYVYRQQTTYTP